MAGYAGGCRLTPLPHVGDGRGTPPRPGPAEAKRRLQVNERTVSKRVASRPGFMVGGLAGKLWEGYPENADYNYSIPEMEKRIISTKKRKS